MHVEDDIVSDEQDDMDDDDLMTNGDGSPLTIDENSESGDRIIYPWMKKIHVAGVGEYKLITMCRPVSSSGDVNFTISYVIIRLKSIKFYNVTRKSYVYRPTILLKDLVTYV